jgi:Domain of unknown function (DUF4190)
METKRTSGLSISAMILGILGLVFVWAPFLGFVLGILGIIFGGIGMGQTRRDLNLGGRGMAIAGLVCGIIGVAIWIILVALFGIALVFSSNTY